LGNAHLQQPLFFQQKSTIFWQKCDIVCFFQNSLSAKTISKILFLLILSLLKNARRDFPLKCLVQFHVLFPVEGLLPALFVQ